MFSSRRTPPAKRGDMKRSARYTYREYGTALARRIRATQSDHLICAPGIRHARGCCGAHARPPRCRILIIARAAEVIERIKPIPPLTRPLQTVPNGLLFVCRVTAVHKSTY